MFLKFVVIAKLKFDFIFFIKCINVNILRTVLLTCFHSNMIIIHSENGYSFCFGNLHACNAAIPTCISQVKYFLPVNYMCKLFHQSTMTKAYYCSFFITILVVVSQSFVIYILNLIGSISRVFPCFRKALFYFIEFIDFIFQNCDVSILIAL